MSGRTLAVLAIAAVLAVVAAWYVRQPPQAPAPEAAAEALVPGLAERLPEVERVRVRVAGGRLLASVERAGDGWRVANRYDYPADPETLRSTLIALAEARRSAPRTERPAGWPRLGLAPIEAADATGVELELEGIEPAPRILIGKPAAGDAEGTYVRRVGEGERAWLVSESIERPDRIADWLDDTLVDIASRRLRGARLEPRDGEPIEIDRGESGRGELRIANRPEGRRLLSPTIARSLARIVTELELVEVHPAGATDTPPILATATFSTFGGLRITIEALAATRGGQPRYIRLDAAAADGAPEAIRAEAEAIRSRVDGWLYEIEDFKFVNLTQTLEGVLEEAR